MRRLALAALSLLVSLTACDNSEPKPALDAVTVSDVVSLDSTTPEPDVVADTAAPEDIAAVEDIATEDTTTPADIIATPDTTPGEDTTSPDTVSADVAPADVAPTDVTPSNGACDNDADRAELAEEAANISGYSTTCAIGCISDPNQASCNTTCLNNNENWTVTESCTTCFGAVAACTSTQCVFGNGGPCFTFDLTKPPTQACIACQENYCFPDFEACAGIEIPTVTP